ncbi:hypothetical protein [Terrimonas pollutisoli]|nr:hypothetical protein [Terrimonas sp. H1YJ31]
MNNAISLHLALTTPFTKEQIAALFNSSNDRHSRRLRPCLT